MQLAWWMTAAGRRTRDVDIHRLFHVTALGGPELIEDRWRRARVGPAREALQRLLAVLAGRFVIGVGDQMRKVLVGRAGRWPYHTLRTVNLRSRALARLGPAEPLPPPVLCEVTLIPYPAATNYRRRRMMRDVDAGHVLVESLHLSLRA